MKVVFPTCCGIDVHKSFLVATIIKTQQDSLQPSYQKKRFSTFNSDLNRFADWLHENDCLDVCMESTGKYWVPVFNILEKRGIRVVIANPKWVKAVKGNKDDTKDSKWIGDLFRIGLVKSSFIPDKDIRILRELTRYRYKLTSMRSSEKNRFQNALPSAMWRWIPSCPICLANPQPLLRITSHPTRILTPSIVFLCYSVLSGKKQRTCSNRLRDMKSQPNRKLALESSGTTCTTLTP